LTPTNNGESDSKSIKDKGSEKSLPDAEIPQEKAEPTAEDFLDNGDISKELRNKSNHTQPYLVEP